MRRGTNLPAIGGYNQAVVLDAVRRDPDGLSRSEIATRTGLSAQTVTNVARRLLDLGLIREAGTVISGPGKPRTLLQLVARGRFAVGVHIDPAVVTAVLLDLEGAVVEQRRVPTPSASDPAVVVDLIARTVESLIDRSGVDADLVLGIGLASPGPIDVTEGVVLDPPMLPSWRHVPLRRALGEATGLPVLLEKDVTAAAVAESWSAGGGDHRRDFAFVYYGTGFGTGLVVGGEPLRGASSNAGDAGHLTVSDHGRRCGCGRVGCVGTLITPHELVRRAVEGGVLTAHDLSEEARVEATASGDGVDMTLIGEAFGVLADRARSGDAGARAIVDGAGRHLARAVVVLVNLLDVDAVVFGGPFWDLIGAQLLPVLAREVRGSAALIAKHPVELRVSSIGADVAAVGAACLVLDHAYSPRPSALLISA